HKVVVSEEIDIPGFSDNPPDRCYYCKSELFTVIKHIADTEKYDVVFDGSNADDLNDYRPGRRAIKEKGVVSPLCDAGFTKLEIRLLSKKYELPTADKPAYACLASRFPYGEKITKEKLDRVGKAEKEIREIGFSLFRVRNHDNLARLEFMPKEIDMAWRKRDEINEICHKAGFTFVAVDIQGYRTGAMNEVLNISSKK
ncbi:MAG: ATP-dependent sacrificial sulfur transferase LarE, partial [Clostridiaceae bacterium]|nr:ATP-dependent sacrificial sulfur transferase LarE [Clostridiaceae bacterium]